MSEKVKLPDFTVDNTVYNLSQKVDWGINQMNIPQAWRKSKGDGITVAVLDTGHPEHFDLPNCEEGYNALDGINDFKDAHGHQTHCAGILCASDNDFGTVGVAPNIKCISVKVLSDTGSGSVASVVSGLDYCIKIKPDIVSMSLGGSTPSPLMHEKIKKLYNMNIPVVCAAGNTGSGGVNWPAAFEETIAVAAFDKEGKVAWFSSRGDMVEWAAPGVNILSTYRNNGYAVLSGTSMACPFMAGILALMLSKHKKQEADTGKNDCKTVEQMRSHLLRYTMDRGVRGKDNSWGYGVIDVKKLFNISSSSSSKSSASSASSSSLSSESSSKSSQSSSNSSKSSSEIPFHDGVVRGKGMLVWAMIGLFIAVAVTFFVVSKCTKDDFEIPEPPEYPTQEYWDEKLQKELDGK